MQYGFCNFSYVVLNQAITNAAEASVYQPEVNLKDGLICGGFDYLRRRNNEKVSEAWAGPAERQAPA